MTRSFFFRIYSIFFLARSFTTRHQLVFKYDWYDPNTKIKGKDIKANYGTTNLESNLSSADIMYQTYGMGVNLYYKNLMLMVFYEIVMNEITSIGPIDDSRLVNQGKNPSSGFANDVKDNILTIRLQYKF